MRFVLLLVLATTACANLPDVSATGCGNGIVEQNEDCDTKDATCFQCSYTCGNCPDGYACGADQLCHAPSGVFHRDATGMFPFPGFQPFITDISGDGIPDVIALSQSSMTIVYGDAQGALQAQTSQVTPLVLDGGGFALRTFGDPPQPQILLATADGIASYVPQSKQLLPYPFTNGIEKYFAGCTQQLAIYDPISLFPFDGGHIHALLRDRTTNALAVGVLDVVTGACAATPACGLPTPSAMNAQQSIYADVYVTSSSATAVEEVLVVGLPMGQACLLRAKTTPATVPGAETIETIGVQNTHGLQSALAVIASNAGNCPSFVTSGANGGLAALLPSGTDAIGCTYGTQTIAIDSATDPIPAGFFPVGHVALHPAIAGVGPDGIMISNGPFGESGIIGVGAIGATSAPASSLYQSNEALFYVVNGDIYGNGQSDAVALAFFDIEILRPLGGSTFATYRIPTQGAVHGLVVSDLDVDGHADIAYIETIGTVDRLMVAYGTDTEPLPPVEVATFHNVIAFLPFAVPDSADPFDLVPDLAVVQPDPTLPPGSPPLLTLLHGSAQRTLTAYFDPRTSFDTVYEGVVAGQFTTANQDVLAVEAPLPTPAVAAPAASLWEIAGTTSAALGAATHVAAPTVLGGSTADCAAAGGLLCASGARYFTWHLADHDVVLAFDDAGHAATFDTAQVVHSEPPHVCAASDCPLPLGSTGLSLRGMSAANLTGTRELFLAYGAATDFANTDGHVLHCQIDATTGAVVHCTDLVAELPELAGWTCNAVMAGAVTARGRFDPVPDPIEDDVLMLCHQAAKDELVHVAWDPSQMHYVAQLVRELAGARFAVLDDVTGDHVPDLSAVIAVQGFPVVDVFPQCEARDVTCRSANAGGDTLP